MNQTLPPDFGNARGRRVRRGVIGVVIRGGELLMVRRAAGVAKGGFWCFPGGHVEDGETPRAAVTREMMEELGLVVEPERRLGYVRVLDSNHVLSVWQVRSVGREVRPSPAEIAEARWVAFSEARTIGPSLASNEDVFRMLGV